MRLNRPYESAFSKEAKKLVDSGASIISLGLGEPNFQTPKIIQEMTIKAMEEGYTRYCDPMGLKELRELIASKLKTENQLNISYNNILITTGAKQAFLLALQSLLKPGDEVINFSPSFLSFIPAIEIVESTTLIHEIDLTRKNFRINWEEVRSVVSQKTKLIILNSPHNPTGMVLNKFDIEQIKALYQEFPNLHILSDEVYEYFVFDGHVQHSIASSLPDTDRLFIINSFSKSFAMTGWRLGYIVVPEGYRNTCGEILKHSNMNVTTFIQKGACAAFLEGRSCSYISDFHSDLQTNADLASSHFSDNRISFTKPQGGFFGFLDISESGLTSDDYAVKLLKAKHVAVNPGFQMGRNWDDYIRISFSGSPESIHLGINKLVEFHLEVCDA